MQFTPVFEKQLNGLYAAQLVESKDHVSQKTGNESIYVKFIHIDETGSAVYLEDYLSSHPNFIHKIRHLCNALDLQDLYAKGALTGSDIDSNRGKKVTLNVKPRKDQNGKEKNSIVDYEKFSGVDTKLPFDDVIPF